ncbi:zinc finger domain-containing protein [Actinophytocola sp. NPDC049390]|uniref:zinc finger domain-containing protein n=1 Tax=Actinophytocola sp. NPDC049390 TaxID=3363894 RepID=UPI0037AFBA4F
MRKLQGLRLVADPDRVLRDLGPDALTVSRSDFAAAFAGLRRQVKTALVDQTLIAGLGNLLADEILWRARISPRRPCHRLAESDIATLHARMRAVLRTSVRDERVPPRRGWLTGHRDDRPAVCPRCRTGLRRGRVGGRGTVWCPRCQES